jgi:hypothetical protein
MLRTKECAEAGEIGSCSGSAKPRIAHLRPRPSPTLTYKIEDLRLRIKRLRHTKTIAASDVIIDVIDLTSIK